jgi:long-chain acyl-CoA synthetase
MNVTQGLRRALQINPNGLATVFGSRRRNWREIGERVAMLSLNSDRYLESHLATAWAGAVIVPLNIRWSPLENQDALNDCRAQVLFVNKIWPRPARRLRKPFPA